MARITQVVVTCDLEDGDVSAAESVSFSYGGKTYTLDLGKKHLDEVKGALEGFASAGHSAARGARGRRRSATGRAAVRYGQRQHRVGSHKLRYGSGHASGLCRRGPGPYPR